MKKRIMLLSAAFLAALPMAAVADTNAVGAVDATSLNVRSAPSMDAGVLGQLYNGQEMNIITKTGGQWFKIEYNGGIGYVHSGYVVDRRNGTPVVYDKTADMSVQTLEGSEKGQLVVATAKKYLGIPYVYGGSTPSGFDCSGLVQYVFRELGVSLNRVAADQTAHGVPVAKENLLPGDIVFFHNTSKYTRINHVGIYVGDGNFIHAPQTGDVVKISTLESGYYAGTLVTARRIFE